VFALGLGAALLASVLFNVGIALQGLEARKAPRRLELRPQLLVRLLRSRVWLLGWFLGLVGIGPQILALDDAPFVVVQPALAVGLLLLLVLGVRAFGERVGPAEIAGVLAIVGGVALVAYGAPTRAEAQRGLVVVVLVCAALGVPSLAPFAVRGTRLDTGMLAIVASGCGFGLTNIATKLMSDAFSAGHLAATAAWAVVGLAFGVAATLTGMTAFQRRQATTVVPVTTAVQTFLPILLEPLFLNERWANAALDGIPIAIGLALAFVGTVLVSRTRAVSALAASASRS
jgi:drug/metabolite transporter (DMT)-like permease